MNRIDAIKLLRRVTRVSLAEARDITEIFCDVLPCREERFYGEIDDASLVKMLLKTTTATVREAVEAVRLYVAEMNERPYAYVLPQLQLRDMRGPLPSACLIMQMGKALNFSVQEAKRYLSFFAEDEDDDEYRHARRRHEEAVAAKDEFMKWLGRVKEEGNHI